MTQLHLDDESLSAALDRQDATGAAHVATCATCRARSDALCAAGRAVAATGPDAGAPPGVADRAVAAALSAFAAERDAGAVASAPGGNAGRPADNVVPLRAPASGLSDSFTSRGPATGGGRDRRVPGWLMGVAAALIAVLVAVPVITRGGGDDGQDTVASGPTDDGAEASTLAGAPPIEGGDLGDQSDQRKLGALVTGALGAPAPPAPAGDQATSAAGGSPEAVDRSRPSAASGAAPSSPSLGAPPLASPSAPGVSTFDASAIAACEATVAEEYAEGLGPLVYRATLRWQGTPAVLLTYRLADTAAGGPDYRGFVMALDGCRLLVVQGF